jgi:hypothetical protein
MNKKKRIERINLCLFKKYDSIFFPRKNQGVGVKKRAMQKCETGADQAAQDRRASANEEFGGGYC